MDAETSQSLARLLENVDGAERDRLTRIFPMIYDDLRLIARRYMDRQASNHTLQPTALVNEAYLRMRDRETPWKGQHHALAVAAIAMRCILVDYARGRTAQKRGGKPGDERAAEFSLGAWDAPATSTQERDLSILELDVLLRRFAELDPRRARVVELRFFGGLTNEEIATALGIARSTVAEDWAVARAWLRVQLNDESNAGGQS